LLAKESDIMSASQGTACCVWVFALITLCLFLALSMRISWIMNMDYVEPIWCRTWTGYWYICGYTGSGDTIWTRPINEDKLPRPKDLGYTVDVPLPNGTVVQEEAYSSAGDGEADYWSSWVGLTVGSVGSILLLMATCGPLTRRGTAPSITGFCVFTCFVLHLVTAICMGIQFFTKEDDQWVYNKFRGDSTDPLSAYQQYSTTLADYLAGDKYLYSYGNVVYTCFFFNVFILPIELVYALTILAAPAEKQWIHGVSEFSYAPTYGDSKFTSNTAEQRA